MTGDEWRREETIREGERRNKGRRKETWQRDVVRKETNLNRGSALSAEHVM